MDGPGVTQYTSARDDSRRPPPRANSGHLAAASRCAWGGSSGWNPWSVSFATASFGCCYCCLPSAAGAEKKTSTLDDLRLPCGGRWKYGSDWCRYASPRAMPCAIDSLAGHGSGVLPSPLFPARERAENGLAFLAIVAAARSVRTPTTYRAGAGRGCSRGRARTRPASPPWSRRPWRGR